MKRPSSYLSYCSIFALLVLFSCQKTLDKVNPYQTDELEGLSIGNVQQWFDENHRDDMNLRRSEQNTKSPNWNRALYLDFKFGEAVAVPIRYKENYSVSFIKNKKDSQQSPQATMPLNSLNYLIVYKDKDNKYIEEVVSIIPEENYVLKSNHMKKNDSFDGMIHISNWDGELLKGFLYEKGKVIGENLGSVNKSLRVARLLDCYQTDYFMCPSENLASNGEILNYAGCSYMFSSPSTCYNIGGSSDNGGGGDSYSSILGFSAADTPLEKTRKLAAKIPQAYKQNEKCVQFGNALKKAMQNNNITGQLLEVRTNIPNRNIISDLYNNGNTAISTNGYHQAIRVGDTVFDNLNPNGVDYNSWRGALDAPGGFTVTPTDF